MASIWKVFTVTVELGVDEDTFSCDEGLNATDFVNETAAEINFEDLEDELTFMIEGLTDNDLVVSQLEIKTLL